MNPQKGLIAFIVDDEPEALRTLADDLRQLPAFAEVYTYASYTEATLPMLEKQPDVIFLDVEVPGRTGLDFLASIRPLAPFPFRVVFYSAYSDYMIDAIRLSAFDFLLKPYKPAELHTVVNRLLNEPDGPAARQVSIEGMPRKLAVQADTELLLLTMEQVLMFRYQNAQRAWTLTLTDGTVRKLRKGTNADDLTALHPAFVRISNTEVLNLNYLEAVENKTQRCRLCPPFEQTDITASRRYFSKLKERLELL